MNKAFDIPQGTLGFRLLKQADFFFFGKTKATCSFNNHKVAHHMYTSHGVIHQAGAKQFS